MNTLRQTAALGRHPTNPFATRHTRPGQIPPLDERGDPRDLAGLLAELRRQGGSAAIIGPHGTGKSTLLAAMVATLAAAGDDVQNLRIRRRRDLIAVLASLAAAAGGGVLGIDSWEVLGRVAGRLVVLLARLRRVRLIVTSHRATPLPTLIKTRATPAVLAAIVRRLPADGGLLEPADLKHAFSRHRGNLREALADLYDRVEERRPRD